MGCPQRDFPLEGKEETDDFEDGALSDEMLAKLIRAGALFGLDGREQISVDHVRIDDASPRSITSQTRIKRVDKPNSPKAPNAMELPIPTALFSTAQTRSFGDEGSALPPQEGADLTGQKRKRSTRPTSGIIRADSSQPRMSQWEGFSSRKKRPGVVSPEVSCAASLPLSLSPGDEGATQLTSQPTQTQESPGSDMSSFEWMMEHSEGDATNIAKAQDLRPTKDNAGYGILPGPELPRPAAADIAKRYQCYEFATVATPNNVYRVRPGQYWELNDLKGCGTVIVYVTDVAVDHRPSRGESKWIVMGVPLRQWTNVPTLRSTSAPKKRRLVFPAPRDRLDDSVLRQGEPPRLSKDMPWGPTFAMHALLRPVAVRQQRPGEVVCGSVPSEAIYTHWLRYDPSNHDMISPDNGLPPTCPSATPDPSDNTPLRLVDLFCGCGALSEGLATAHIDEPLAQRRSRERFRPAPEEGERDAFRIVPVFGVDTEKDAVASYRENMQHHNPDVVAVAHTAEEFRRLLRRMRDHGAEDALPTGFDVVCAGIPCPSFSKANVKRAMDASDDRRQLWKDFFKFVQQEHCPAYLVIEQVDGFVNEHTDTGAAPGLELMAKLVKLGYQTKVRLHCAESFGVAQARIRATIIAARHDWILPDDAQPLYSMERQAKSRLSQLSGIGQAVVSWHNNVVCGAEGLPPPRTIRDAIGHFRVLEHAENGQQQAANWDLHHIGIAVKDATIAKLTPRRGSTGQPRTPRTPGRGRANSSATRLTWDGVFPTLLTGAHKVPIHPEQNRRCTVREVAAGQSMPDYYVIMSEGVTHQEVVESQYRQVGNAVPVPLGRALGRTVLEAARRSLARGRTRTSQHSPHSP